MNNRVLKNTVIAISMLLATGTAFAHSQSGSLGAGAGATDLYQVSCFDDGGGAGPAYHLANNIKAGAFSAGKISIRTQKAAKATNSTDAISGDSVYSPVVYNVGGNGVYYLTVGKTAASSAAISYIIDFHCLSSAGGHAGTSIYMLQNQ